MHTIHKALLSSVLLFSQPLFAALPEQGIYINQGTMSKTGYLNYLIQESKAAGIKTFVIDYTKRSTGYAKNIENVKKNGIKYVARIVVFPDGAKEQQMKSKAYWQQKYQMVDSAIKMGAEEIQLDYIRYSSKQRPSKQNSHDVLEVAKFFKDKVSKQNIPLQLDVFGISSYREIPSIGQSIPVLSTAADAICPMNYPSHWEPYLKYSKEPYQTVYNAIQALRGQFKGKPLSFKLYPYIELSNYRMPMSNPKILNYIEAQIKATEDGHADGWYAWSPQNKYNNLFQVLKTRTKNPS
jgi:hypothetical protein